MGFPIESVGEKKTAKVSCFQLIQNFYFLKDILKKYFDHNHLASS